MVDVMIATKMSEGLAPVFENGKKFQLDHKFSVIGPDFAGGHKTWFSAADDFSWRIRRLSELNIDTSKFAITKSYRCQDNLAKQRLTSNSESRR